MTTPTSESVGIVHRATANFQQDPWWIDQLERHAKAFDVVNEWHRDHHVGQLAHCHEQPCNAVVMAVFG